MSGRASAHADDDRWLEAYDASPSMNLDGTPMAGDLDICGNLYRDCSTSSMWDDGPAVRSRLQQLVRLDAQRDRQLFDVVHRDVPHLALDMRHEGPVQAGLKG
jgi:hypothetical protein